MTRAFYLLYGLVAYLIFFATFLYLIAFTGNLPFAPTTVDTGPLTGAGAALIVDLILIALFGIQHSVMARQGFKRGWTRIVPEPVERSTYLVFTCLVLIAMFVFWRPIPAAVWTVTNPIGAGLLWAVFALGWAIVLVSTLLLNHFELFGLKQVWQYWRGQGAAAPQFRTPLFYRLVRHPLYSGFFLAFWATPAMTAGHIVLALGMSAYMLIAIRYEERDLTALFGVEYDSYRREVGMLTPKLRRS